MSGFQEKITRYTKKAKNIVLRDRASIRARLRYGRSVRIIRPGILTTMVKMLRALMDEADSLQEQIDGQCKQRDGNSKKEPKRNARNQKHYIRNEE